MPNPIVIAYHIIWTGYGWWLPNDPRGSHFTTIAADVLKQLGEAHLGRKKIQPPGSFIGEFYTKAESLLQFPLLAFGPDEMRMIADSFAQKIVERKYTCYACSIMPDHVHILIRKHKDDSEQMITELQVAGMRAIAGHGEWGKSHPVFTVGGWKVFLDDPEEIWRTIDYIEQNPAKIGWPVQKWEFVKAYDNWPLHEGHSPNSPYARRLRESGRGRC